MQYTGYSIHLASFPGSPRKRRGKGKGSVRSRDGKLGVGPGYEATIHQLCYISEVYNNRCLDGVADVRS